jgi:hypothetical protein
MIMQSEAQTAEPAYYSDLTTQVTDTQVVFGDKIYPLASVTSARVRIWRPARFKVAIGCLVGALALVVLNNWLDPPTGSALGSLLLSGQTLLTIAGILFALFSMRGVRYVVQLSGTFGREDGLSLESERQARQVAGAVNRAVKEQVVPRQTA